MINEKEIDGLRHTEYSSDPVVMEMLDTLELLWKVANAAEKFDIYHLSDAEYGYCLVCFDNVCSDKCPAIQLAKALKALRENK